MVHLCYALIFSTLVQPALISPFLGEIRLFYILAAVVCIAALMKEKAPGPWENIPQKKLILFMLFAYFISEFQYLNVHRSISNFDYWGKKVLIFFAVNVYIDTEKRLKTAIWMAVLACSVLSYFAYGFYALDPALPQWEGRLQSVGYYNLSNSYALILTIIWPLAFILFETERSVLKRMFLLFVAVVFFCFALLTKSRGGIFGMTFAVCFSFLLSKKMAKYKLVKVIFIFIVLSIVTKIGFSLVMQRHEVAGMLGGDTSADDRIMVWKAAFRMLISHPLFGIGWDHFYDDAVLYGSDRRLLAHNTIISVFAETGLVGGITFLLILKHSFVQLYRTMKNGTEMIHVMAKGLFVSLAAFMINTSFSVKDHDPSFWLVISLTAACTKIFIKQQSEKNLFNTFLS